MLTILKFSASLILLIFLSIVMLLVAPFVAIHMACSYTAIKIVSSLYVTVNQLKKE